MGNYQQALAFAEKSTSPFAAISPKDSAYFLQFSPVNARAYILERARNEQIIMINEAHHVPLHRVFTSSLLADLYRLGFRYFGAEALGYTDSLLAERGYPVLETGYYTQDPQFGNLIREALAIGYDVFPYEAVFDNDEYTPKEREIRQARNIQKLLQKDLKARILIHAGFDHIREDSIGGSWEKPWRVG